jgi:8-oxo-dGTP pyrophosphatase MutT (NUDIX family)/phosphohistidine phosphatase SixA
VIQAAGALPWRRRRGALQVALVHRPRYDDWSWPKGKLDPAEAWPAAAVREVFEETGLRVRLGRTLPTSVYSVADAAGKPTTKECRYWAAEVVGGDGALVNEIDEVEWLDVPAASARLTYARDSDQLRALELADSAGTLTSWPLVIVRHAKSRSRASWSRPDPLRPLSPRGRERAQALVPILAAYVVTRVVTSPSVRCVDTVQPYSAAAGARLRMRPALSEEGFAEQPERACYHLTRLLERGIAAALCSHGPVLPALFEMLAEIADSEIELSSEPPDPDPPHPRGADDSPPQLALSEAANNGLGKGEAFVVHVVGTGEEARIVDVERHRAS